MAVKVIHRQLDADPEFRTRFRREVAADGPVESQMAVAGGIAYFGSERVYALKGRSPDRAHLTVPT